jgi:hypothetical protein
MCSGDLYDYRGGLVVHLFALGYQAFDHIPFDSLQRYLRLKTWRPLG